MQHKVVQDLKGDAIVARDGSIGSVKDMYFDDERWAVRYLVVDTGSWLPGRKVLISAASVAPGGASGDEIRVQLTRAQVERAPGTDQDPPISRMLEEAHARYYGYPQYWTGPYLWGPQAIPAATPPAESPQDRQLRQAAEQRAHESHLRSSAEVVGYRIHAADGELGHVEDFLVDDRDWAIAEVIVDTRNWLPGRKVRVPVTEIESIDWASRHISVRLKREQLKQAPQVA